jgi:hypothetical protein
VQGLPLVVVELTFGQKPFTLKPASDAEVLVQRRTNQSNAMWQKERLLNIALSFLPAQCTKVVWLDADTFFTNPNWVAETSKHVRTPPPSGFSLRVCSHRRC